MSLFLKNLESLLFLVIEFLFNNSLQIRRFILVGLLAYIFTIFLIYFFQILSFSPQQAIIITQLSKIIIMYFIMKLFVFKNDNTAPHSFKFYIVTVIFLRVLELILMYIASSYEVDIFIYVFFVLGLSSVIKFFIFKNIFGSS